MGKNLFFFCRDGRAEFSAAALYSSSKCQNNIQGIFFFWVETVDCYPGVAGQRMRYIFSDKKKKKLSPYSHRHKVDSSTPAVQPHYLSLPVYSLVSSKEARRKKKGT